MERLRNSEAEPVFRFFEEICRIPHGSGNIGAISDYLADFAGARGLACMQDSVKNIIIIKEATAGYEQEEPVLLQGHMDMVAVKKPGCAKDMRTEGLDLAIDGDWLYARDTSLGGDDGIAVAYMLALLDSDRIAHPRLECMITVDEETGMNGASSIDPGICRSRRMLNLDSEEEGIFLASCAGGARIAGRLPLTREAAEGVAYTVRIGGLQGGHSGGEIHKERGNANCLAGRLFYECHKAAGVRLILAEGGLADNAIPREARLVLLAAPEQTGHLEETLDAFSEAVKRELAVKDPGFFLTVQDRKAGRFEAATEADSEKAARLLLTLPNGVQAMSADLPGLVQTSLNLGILKTGPDALQLDFSVRSSVGSEKALLLEKVKALVCMCGGTGTVSGDYPAWEYRQDSALREKMTDVYRELYHAEPRVEAIHAGLECGLLSGKLPGLDCVSIGPDMRDIHTTEERLSIPSVERVWKFLLAFLERKG